MSIDNGLRIGRLPFPFGSLAIASQDGFGLLRGLIGTKLNGPIKILWEDFFGVHGGSFDIANGPFNFAFCGGKLAVLTTFCDPFRNLAFALKLTKGSCGIGLGTVLDPGAFPGHNKPMRYTSYVIQSLRCHPGCNNHLFGGK